MYKKREQIRIIRAGLEAGNLLGKSIAMSKVKCFQTIDDWRHKPARFSKFWHLRCDRLLTLCQEKSENKRVDAVEDAQFNRLIKGEASPAEYIFYLCNRRKDKWQNNYRVEHSGKIEGGESKFIIINNGKSNEQQSLIAKIRNHSTAIPE